MTQIAGQCALGRGNTDANFIRLIELHYAEPQSGIIIVNTTSPGLDWATRLTMGSGLGGPTFFQVWHQERIALAWAGQDVSLEVKEMTVGGPVTFCACAGINGATSDSTSAFSATGGTTPAETVRIQDGNGNLDFALVPTGTGSLQVRGGLSTGAILTGAIVEADATISSVTADGSSASLRCTDAQALIAMPYVQRQGRVRGSLNENAFGAGGTANVLAAPAANLANVLTSVQFGAPTATTVVTLESPSGTVLWAGRLILTLQPHPIVMPSPLLGATAGAWVVRSSIASTFSVNVQGFTERQA
jgi:hypothetical protein